MKVWAKYINKHFTKDIYRNQNTHKKMLRIFNHKKMPIKNAMRYYYTLFTTEIKISVTIKC